MDAITMLKDDHKTVEKLFTQFEDAGDRAYVRKREIVDRIIEELSVHAAVEEMLLYPVARATVPDTEDIALESMEEHGVAKWLLHDLDSLDPQDERFDAKVTVLIENVRHHVEEEEQEFFPKVRDELGRKDLQELGDAMVEAKKTAPTKPHPRSPDAPPANLLVGTVAGVADRIGDTVYGVAQGSVSAVQDVVAVILRRPRPQQSPRGSKVSRTTARRLRSNVSSAAESVIESIESARDTGEDVADAATSGAKGAATSAGRGATRTAKAARSGAKATTTSAKRSGSQATTTAKRAATTTGRTAKKAAKTTKAQAKGAATSTAKAASDSE
ncbi:hemerythrin domain-containing protein [Iamia majanohamensis]|uniref:Hemerythrin domain-containing protein n=1 Tax=Iamia majanohamensis TaxID=467976 RepID=A0AAF0BWB2_9ACTN|nr:hemerythrin domain-containing protein [Iamia majanohamensis]WCO67239.1 hemerythrin domain-containing protein [Iamia majanohamensis]